MPISKITYADKVTLNENTGIDDTNKVKASDMNSIKEVVNANADETQNNTNNIQTNTTDISNLDTKIDDLSTLVNSFANLFFPINKIVIFNDNDDHSNYLGFTWERIATGKTLVGIDSSDTDFDTIGKTGGAKTHTITIDEMPEHTHQFEYTTVTGTAGYNTLRADSQVYSGNIQIGNTYPAGGGQPHNNVQPYQVVAYWLRTA